MLSPPKHFEHQTYTESSFGILGFVGFKIRNITVYIARSHPHLVVETSEYAEGLTAPLGHSLEVLETSGGD